MLAESSLISCLLYAALAFGGTEPALFSVAQIVLFAAFAFLVLAQPDLLIPANPAARIVPVVLVAIVLLQLCPLPPSWVGRSRPALAELAGSRWTRWTIQSYATRTHLCWRCSRVWRCFISPNAGVPNPRRKAPAGFFSSRIGHLRGVLRFGPIPHRLPANFCLRIKKYDLEEATGTYVNRNHYAGLLEMILPFSLALAFYEFERLRRRAGAIAPPQTEAVRGFRFCS
jgi:hypothetical protein